MKKVRIEKLNGRDIFSVIAEGLDSFGLSQRLKSLKRVFIKPNLVSDVLEYIQNGSNTDIRVIEGVLRYLSDYNVKVFLGESDSGPQLKGRKLKYALEYMGVYDLQKKYDFTIVNLTHDKKALVKVPKPLFLKEIELGKTLLDADLIINLPKIKTHKYATLTCSLKNMFGTIPDPLRVKYHPNIHAVLADLNSLYYSKMFVVVDGIIAMEGNGPIYGKPVNLDLLLFADDPLAADVTAARIIGIVPEEIEHLLLFKERYANKWDKGDLNQIKTFGNVTLEEVYRPFVRSELIWFLRIERRLLPHPWFLKFIYSRFALMYIVYPLRKVIKRLRGGASSWYLDSQRISAVNGFLKRIKRITDIRKVVHEVTTRSHNPFNPLP
jgi:uncharacterized protein (DUF362 family)